MKAQILIVEDEPELAELVQVYLSFEGIDSQIAGSAEEAKQHLGHGKFDLLILDINLPGMDGFEFVSKVKALGVDSYITFISAETDTGTVRKMIDAGDFGLIRKPVSIDDLREKLLTARIVLKLDKKLK